MDMIDHPLFWDGPYVLRPDETILIDNEGFGHAVDSKIDANLTRSIHSVRKSLTELTDKPSCSSFVILDIHSDHSDSAILVSLPDSLEPWRLFIAGRVAPGSPEIHHNDPSTESVGVDNATIK